MDLIGYGEDALTLWGIKNKIHVILEKLNDYSDISNCRVFFRPSFGRRGGDNSAQFGEFDFIILTEKFLYLGESKWNRSSENKDGVLELRQEQELRHEIFTFYVEEWLAGNYLNWSDFVNGTQDRIRKKSIKKPLAPINSLLSSNLQTILEIIKNHFNSDPKIKNLLLYFHEGKSVNLSNKIINSFELVSINYSKATMDNFIKI